MKQKLIEITKKLINFKTVSPEGNEYKCAYYITQLMRSVNMKVVILAKNKKRPNVIGQIGTGKKSLVIACHMDTVPAGNGWKTPPFKAVVAHNKIYGRGAIDDKGPFAISFCAIKKFVDKFPSFDGKVFLIALADEEADNVYGVKHLLSKGFRANAGLIPDGGYFSKLDIGEKGCAQLKITSFGKQAHSALDENGVNAISTLTEVVENIKKIKWSQKYNKLFSPTKVNFSIFHSGEFANIVPASAYVQMDIRFPLGINSGQVIKKIKSSVKQSGGKNKVEVIYKTEPHLVKEKNLIKTFIHSAKNLGYKVNPVTLAGNSVAKEFNQAGIPSIVHYPMNYIPAHEPNEHVDISQMVNTVNIYYEFLINYFNVK